MYKPSSSKRKNLGYRPKSTEDNGDKAMTIESAEAFVQAMADGNYSGKMLTEDPAESAIIMAEILKHADKEVKIYSSTLSDKFVSEYDPFFIELNRFLISGKTLKIALQNSEKPDSLFYEILSEYAKIPNDQLQIRVANNMFYKNMRDVMKERTDFMVDDRNAYRLEVNSPKPPFNRLHSLFSFNDKDISERLNKAFNDEIFKKCPSLI